MAVARRGVVSLDCAEPHPLAAFWASMLDGEITIDKPTAVIVRTDWVWIAALKVADYVAPTWPSPAVPKQMHLDLAVSDLDAAVDAALDLGARLGAEQASPDRWRVLLDPAGHPFCLTTISPFRE